MLKKIVLPAMLFILGICGSAQASLDIVITEGVDSARPLGIVPFQWKGHGEAPIELSKVVAEDLRRSGKFNPIKLSDMPQTPSSPAEVNYDAWAALGVEAVLLGKIEAQADESYLVSYVLVDIIRGKANNEGKQQVQDGNLVTASDHISPERYKTVKKVQLRQMAHLISDSVYKSLTGERGAFLTRIAYVAVNNKSSHPYQLRVADYDGYNETSLVRSSEPIMSPSWSPDGKRLAYVSFENRKAEIFIYSVYDRNTKPELLSSFTGINGAPKWSPDGTKMAVVLSKDGQPDIYVMDIATKQLDRLTKSRRIDTEPSWSKDGTEIYFSSERGGNPQIYKVDVATKKAKRVTWEGDMNLGPAITPDGRAMVMVSRVNGQFRIARQDFDTGYVHVLTRTQLDESPSIAPNGSMIMYSTVVNQRRVLALVSMDGRFKATLPAQEGDVRAPAWSPFLN